VDVSLAHDWEQRFQVAHELRSRRYQSLDRAETAPLVVEQKRSLAARRNRRKSVVPNHGQVRRPHRPLSWIGQHFPPIPPGSQAPFLFHNQRRSFCSIEALIPSRSQFRTTLLSSLWTGCPLAFPVISHSAISIALIAAMGQRFSSDSAWQPGSFSVPQPEAQFLLDRGFDTFELQLTLPLVPP
jgi:hypothetical protein